MTEKTLKIQGMSCDHCRMAVTRALSAVPGVTGVEVSLEEGTAKVSFDESRVPSETLQRAIEGAGYQVV
jgi:copper chaperone